MSLRGANEVRDEAMTWPTPVPDTKTIPPCGHSHFLWLDHSKYRRSVLNLLLLGNKIAPHSTNLLWMRLPRVRAAYSLPSFLAV